MRQKKQRSSGGGASWMDTYGDLVTLLLTFFVMLFASSTVNEDKWIAIVESFRGEPSGSVIESIDIKSPTQGFSESDIITRNESDTAQTVDEQEELLAMVQQMMEENKSDEQKEIEQQFDSLYESLNSYITANNLQDSLMLTKDGMMITVTIMEGMLFESGDANILDDPALGKTTLEAVAAMTKEYIDSVERITVEGHTDNNPINNAMYEDNFDLSSKRANNVVRFMSNSAEIEKSMFDSLGRGEWLPIASNDTNEGKAKNRRVNIILTAKNVDEFIDQLAQAEAKLSTSNEQVISAINTQPEAILSNKSSRVIPQTETVGN